MRRKLTSNGLLMLFLMLLQSLFVMAWATPVVVNEKLNDLDLIVESSLVGLKGMAFVENREQQPVVCDVVFLNGPELPVKRREMVGPGVKKVFVARMKRSIVKLTIDVTCNKK